MNAGLRTEYKFGLYSYCAYVNDTHGTCSNSTAGTRLQPFLAFLGDIPSNYTGLTNSFIPDTTFTNSSYLGDFSRGAYYLLLLGSIAVALALFTSVLLFCAYGEESCILTPPPGDSSNTPLASCFRRSSLCWRPCFC